MRGDLTKQSWALKATSKNFYYRSRGEKRTSNQIPVYSVLFVSVCGGISCCELSPYLNLSLGGKYVCWGEKGKQRHSYPPPSKAAVPAMVSLSRLSGGQ